MIAEDEKMFEDAHVGGKLLVAVENLQEVQDELEQANEKYSTEIWEVDQKYDGIKGPLYAKRNSIIKSIPEFWFTAFLTHPELRGLLVDEDYKVFKYLDSIDVEFSKDVYSSYSISFYFKSNPYMEDMKLMKTYNFSHAGECKMTGTTINWKQCMGSAGGVNIDEQNTTFKDSFFSWFSKTEAAELPGFQDIVAEVIRDDLWPNPLRYFRNESDDISYDEGRFQLAKEGKRS